MMSYQEFVATRSQRAAEWAAIKADSCAGCGVQFSAYGMTKADGYSQDGKIYCNSDCCCSAEVSDAERADYESLSD